MLRRFELSVVASQGGAMVASAAPLAVFRLYTVGPALYASSASSGGSTRRSMRRLQCVNALPVVHPAAMTSSSSLQTARRFGFFDRFRGSQTPKVTLDSTNFDKTETHYTGKIFGLPADDVMFYLKVVGASCCCLFVIYVFLKGYVLLSHFSLQNVARLGFFGGFFTCAVMGTTAVAMLRRVQINANAVYNQSIALVLRNEKVVEFLGGHPQTSEFKSYCATGGFKLPLLRRIRSGSYELSDLLGLKQRRLQMLFALKNPATGREGLVSCDVRKETTGVLSYTNVYRSLAITLTDPAKGSKEAETIILLGKPDDVVYKSLIR